MSWANQSKDRKTIASDIFSSAKKEYRAGPHEYDLFKKMNLLPQHPRFADMKTKRVTLWDQIILTEKKKKGPTDYETWKRPKILGHSKVTEPSGSNMSELTYRAQQTPGVCAYKTELVKDKLAGHKVEVDFSRNKSERFLTLKKDNSPSPHSYADKDKNWKKLANW